MKRALVITCSLESPNGICIKSILNEAERRKIKVDCICSAGDVKNTEYITYYPTSRRLLDKFYYGRKKIDSWQYHLCLWGLRIAAFFTFAFWPFSAPLYYKKLRALSFELAAKNQYDIVVGTYNFYETLLAAYEVKKRHSDIKFVPYFLDCLAGGRGPRYVSENVTRKLGLRRERKILPLADQVVIMKSHEEFYRKLWSEESWKDRVKILDIPLLYNMGMCRNKRECNEVRQILYTGALQVDLKNPQFFLDILSHCKADNIKVTFVGPSNCGEIVKAARKKLKNSVEQKDPVPHEQAIELMKNADILLNIGSTNIRQIPCKIFEYMAIGKPIISTAPVKDEPSIKYLSQYPAALILYETDTIETNSQKLRNFLARINELDVDFSKLEEMMYICTPGAFIDLIEEQVEIHD